MLYKRPAALVAMLGLATWLMAGNAGRSQEPQPAAPQNGDGVEVLTRGPIHEAFAEPVEFKPEPTKIVPKQPPDPIEELPPDEKPAGDNVQWFPGYWAWDDERSDYIWISGIWRNPPPGRQWMPGHWSQLENGWQWAPGFWALAEQKDVQYLPPPPAPLEATASVPAPNADSVMIPGTWTWGGSRYLWRPPYWVDYRPGWVWIPAHFVWTPGGFVFVDGYWDFELSRRGLLFSPVYFTQPLWQRPSWVFRPSFAVYDSFLMGALFLRPGFYHYYYGDFFDARYTNLGFRPWLDFRFGRFNDPLFSYYRWSNRGDRAWLTDLRFVYDGRFRGNVPRPPRTFAQQATILNNVNRTTVVNNINITKYVTATAPITKFEQKNLTLQPVSRTQIAEVKRLNQELRATSLERRKIESGLVKTGTAPLRGQAVPQVVQFAMPKMPAVKTDVKIQPPPLPVTNRAIVGPRTPGGVNTLPSTAVPRNTLPNTDTRPSVITPRPEVVEPKMRVRPEETKIDPALRNRIEDKVKSTRPTIPEKAKAPEKGKVPEKNKPQDKNKPPDGKPPEAGFVPSANILPGSLPIQPRIAGQNIPQKITEESKFKVSPPPPARGAITAPPPEIRANSPPPPARTIAPVIANEIRSNAPAAPRNNPPPAPAKKDPPPKEKKQ